MRRVASHYIYWKQFYRMHYAELDDRGVLAGVFPLEEEIAGTEFYDGILIPGPALDAGSQENRQFHRSSYLGSPFAIPRGARERVALSLLPGETLADALQRQGFPNVAEVGSPACLLLLSGISLAAAKLGADDGRRNGYIQRL